MNTQHAYNLWADQYDTNQNKTRDLEGIALREVLSNVSINQCLEIGCGTGKNTAWLSQRAEHVTSVDLSEEMLAKAKAKIASDNVTFKQADVLREWDFTDGVYDLITFSLVLEHIQDLNAIFEKASHVIQNGGHIYIGELHPFKQYLGSKARFETAEGTQVLECFQHHLSDFIAAAQRHGFSVAAAHEYFDEGNRNEVPRILSILLMMA